jgi:hypothetical protein
MSPHVITTQKKIINIFSACRKREEENQGVRKDRKKGRK